MSTATLGRPARRGTAARLGLLSALLSALAFASSGPFAKALLGAGWTPAAVVLARVGLGGLVLLGPALAVLRRGGSPSLRTQVPFLAAFGVLAVAAPQVAYFNAVARMPVGVALLLEYLGIVLVVLWGWVRWGRRPGRWTVVGTVLAIVGLVLVLDVAGGLDVDVVGAAWGLAAAVGLAAYFVLSAGSVGRVAPVVLAAFGMLGAAGVLLLLGLAGLVPLQAGTGDVLLRGAVLPSWVAVLELSVVAAAAAYLLGTVGARQLGSTVASFVGLTEVLFAVALAWVLLGELPRAVQLLGGVFLLAGVIAVRLPADGGARRWRSRSPLPVLSGDSEVSSRSRSPLSR